MMERDALGEEDVPGFGEPTEPAGFTLPPFPPISDDRVLAAKEDPQARSEVATRLFGQWPLPGPEQAEWLATRRSSYLGRLIRHLYPESLDDLLVAAAVDDVAEEYEPRLIGKYKRERGRFSDWVRLTVEDLATQTAIRRFQQAEALVVVAEAKQAGEPVPEAYAHLPEMSGAQFAEARAAASQLRQAVHELVWLRDFHVEPEAHPPGEIRLARAAGWIKDIYDAARIEVRLEACETLAHEFFMGKILERNILRQFDPAKRSSFNQWLKTAVQNYARDKLAQSATPPVYSLSDALHSASRAELDEEPLAVSRDAPPADFASEAAPEMPEESVAWEIAGESALTVPASGSPGEGLGSVLAAVLPGILADELQQALLKLFFGLVPSEADFKVLARERLTRWGALLCLEALGVKRRDPGEALEVPGLAEAKQRLREAAAVAGIEAPAQPPPEARDLSDAQAAALERYAYAVLTHTSGPAPALPKALRDSPLAGSLNEKLALMRRVLMALEHLPAADGGESVLLATSSALGQWLESAHGEAGLEQQEFQSRALRTINQRQTKLRQLEAKQRQHEAGSAEWHELEARINEVRQALRNKAEELRKRTFGPSDADLARLLGMEPGSVAGVKSRLLRSVREFLDAERLAQQRRNLATPLRQRAGEALAEAYEARLQALAAWQALPHHEATAARLQALLPAGRFTEASAARYRALLERAQHATGEQAEQAHTELEALRGDWLDRQALEAQGLEHTALLAYEGEALRLFTALVMLQELATGKTS